MAERPILFSGEMVRTILAGTKTMTRRAVKPQPDRHIDGEPYWSFGGYRLRASATNPLRCPYGQPGDTLWVRETWACDSDINNGRPIEYRATWKCERDFHGVPCEHGPDRWRPSIHMPRWASRLTLDIAGVRVERLQDISEEDACAEGVEQVELRHVDGGEVAARPSYRDSFARLWRSIYGDESWDANPWVWVVGFKHIEVSRGR